MVSIALVALAAVLVLGWLLVTKTVGRDTLAATADRRTARSVELTATLTRTAQLGDLEAQVVLATPTFFKLTNREADARALGADRSLVFVMNETTHFSDLPHHPGAILRLDGASLAVPTEVRVLTDAVHHRTSALVFADVPASTSEGGHSIELLLPSANGERASLEWRGPLAYPEDIRDGAGLSLGLVLALGAGLLAAISPCLLQLSAFYLPTLAGVSADASPLGAGARRARILPFALLFVLGFTIPYTLGGAAMGAFGGALSASGLLSPTGAIARGAGVVMLAMALLVAYRARAPLACDLPLPAAFRQGRRLPFVEAFVSGFAIATGCLACFGGAILGVLLVYTGLMGSAFLGASAMLAFSLGLAVPFLLAASSLTRVRPFVSALQRASPAIGLATSLAMAFFGITMATGNYHVVSGWLGRNLPL